jgi:hypothetical protein
MARGWKDDFLHLPVPLSFPSCIHACAYIGRTFSGASAITILLPKRGDRPRVTMPGLRCPDLWSDGTGTLLRVVNPPPFFRSSTEARTPQKDRGRDRRQRELTFDPRQTRVSLSDNPRLTTKFQGENAFMLCRRCEALKTSEKGGRFTTSSKVPVPV